MTGTGTPCEALFVRVLENRYGYREQKFFLRRTFDDGVTYEPDAAPRQKGPRYIPRIRPAATVMHDDLQLWLYIVAI